MTLGEKLKDARKNMGLSQDEMAKKLCVSRQAVTKWESDLGIPDIINLKAISKLLDVSIDFLLDDGTVQKSVVFKEAINLKNYPKPKLFNFKEDFVVLEKYPKADKITQVSWYKKLSKKEKVLDFLFTGVYYTITHWQDPSPYYLVEQGKEYYLVNVTKDFIISKKLAEKINGKTFDLGDLKFKKTLNRIK